jgi:hypothetical protein
MRRGEPTTSLGLALEHSRGNARGPELPHATCLPSGQMPSGYPLPRNRLSITLPGFRSRQSNSPVHSRRPGCSNPCRRPSSQSNASSQGGRLMGIRCRGLGKSVPGKAAFRRQSAAHGQITERKYSIAQFRFSVAIRWCLNLALEATCDPAGAFMEGQV